MRSVKGKCARKPNALLHTAGQLMRIVLRESLEPNKVHEAIRPLFPLGGRELCYFEAEGNVSRDGKPGK
jgi:hypothetical protein